MLLQDKYKFIFCFNAIYYLLIHFTVGLVQFLHQLFLIFVLLLGL